MIKVWFFALTIVILVCLLIKLSCDYDKLYKKSNSLSGQLDLCLENNTELGEQYVVATMNSLYPDSDYEIDSIYVIYIVDGNIQTLVYDAKTIK